MLLYSSWRQGVQTSAFLCNYCSLFSINALELFSSVKRTHEKLSQENKMPLLGFYICLSCYGSHIASIAVSLRKVMTDSVVVFDGFEQMFPLIMPAEGMLLHTYLLVSVFKTPLWNNIHRIHFQEQKFQLVALQQLGVHAASCSPRDGILPIYEQCVS